MAIGPTEDLLARYKQNYGAEDKEEVLAGIQKYGTDDRSQWQDAQPQQQGPMAPTWDRTAFRDAWMGSGVQNVPDMQNWLKSSGWGQHVNTAGSKGDVMQLPSGENIDAVLAAGLGGNRGGPQWTGRGSWNENGGQRQPSQGQGMAPSWGGNQGYGGGVTGGYSGNYGRQTGQMNTHVMPQQRPMSRTQQGQGMGAPQAQMMPKRQPFRQQGMQPRMQGGPMQPQMKTGY